MWSGHEERSECQWPWACVSRACCWKKKKKKKRKSIFTLLGCFHVVSLFFQDVYTSFSIFVPLILFINKPLNPFGISTQTGLSPTNECVFELYIRERTSRMKSFSTLFQQRAKGGCFFLGFFSSQHLLHGCERLWWWRRRKWEGVCVLICFHAWIICQSVSVFMTTYSSFKADEDRFLVAIFFLFWGMYSHKERKLNVFT